MRRGLVIGKFYPPHKGHTFLIDTGRAQVDELTVIVCDRSDHGAPHDLGAYKVLGMLDTTIQDWHLFIAAATGTIVSVNPSAPYKDMNDLLAVMKANPGQVSVATAGVNSSGHLSIETIAQAAGIKYVLTILMNVPAVRTAFARATARAGLRQA